MGVKGLETRIATPSIFSYKPQLPISTDARTVTPATQTLTLSGLPLLPLLYPSTPTLPSHRFCDSVLASSTGYSLSVPMSALLAQAHHLSP